MHAYYFQKSYACITNYNLDLIHIPNFFLCFLQKIKLYRIISKKYSDIQKVILKSFFSKSKKYRRLTPVNFFDFIFIHF